MSAAPGVNRDQIGPNQISGLRLRGKLDLQRVASLLITPPRFCMALATVFRQQVSRLRAGFDVE